MSSDKGAEFPASGEFPASYDAVTKIISAVTCVLALVAAVAIHNPIATAILILVFVLSYAYSPRGYSVSAKTIIVKRLLGNVRIPLEDTRVARKIDADDLRGCIRLWGSGGLFGYYGLFRTTKLGRCTWYATNRKKLFVAIGATKTTVFSPDDVDGFLRAIRAEVPAATSESVQTGNRNGKRSCLKSGQHVDRTDHGNLRGIGRVGGNSPHPPYASRDSLSSDASPLAALPRIYSGGDAYT